jgi:ABC-type glycerol-3-phosphate transport system substrate-binding protein
MKTFHGTTPLLFQYGATLYGENASEGTKITSDAAIKGFTELTELFTIYNLPVDVPNFYQHFRNGDLPIGIAEYGMYNLLTNAAPEIANSWSIANVPGIKDENGNILRYTSSGMESTVMFKSNSQREKMAWEFMKWWSSADVQVEFGQTLQISYGSEFLWSTANTEAFKKLPWKTKDKEVILEQSKWTLEAPRILGTYMLEREMSNAYNSIVVDGKNLRTTLDEAAKNVNRETERKLQEFGYTDQNGNVIKEYKVPTLETVRKILGKSN